MILAEQLGQIPLNEVLFLSALLFSIGVCGVLIRRNAIVIFMSIEIMLNAVNLAFIGFAGNLNSLDGRIFVFFIMVVAAAEAAVGLGIIIAIYRKSATSNVDRFDIFKW